MDPRLTELKVLCAPSRYVQGRNATLELGAEIKAFGLSDTVGIISGKSAKRMCEPLWKESFQRVKMKYQVADFQGECSYSEVERLLKVFSKEKISVVVGAGGGKTLDVARVVAERLSLPFVSCPSAASNDSPCFALSVMYQNTGEYAGIEFLTKNPLLVLVDTQIVANSPARMLVAGMGDALATFFEAKACKHANAHNLRGGKQTESAGALAKLCYETIMAEGRAALDAVRINAVTPALEKLIEANTYLSGVGCEATGVAAAHGIHNGLTLLKDTHGAMHGEKVAFGLMSQFVLEGADQVLVDQVANFYLDVGLPLTFEGIGLHNPSLEMLRQVAERENCDGGLLKNEPFPVSNEMVIDAMRTADEMGKRYQQERARLTDEQKDWRRAS